jgi:hypothetical protein
VSEKKKELSSKESTIYDTRKKTKLSPFNQARPEEGPEPVKV